MSKSFYLCALLFGLIVPVFCNTLLSYPVIFALLVLTFLSFVIRSVIARLCSLLLLGVCINSVHLHQIIGGQMHPQYEGKDIFAIVEVVSEPLYIGENIRFDAKLTGFSTSSSMVDQPTQLLSRRLKLSGKATSFDRELAQGQIWQLVLRLKRPRGFVNPGGFDYHAWLLYHRYSATGYVKVQDGNQLVKKQRSSFISGFRTTLKTRLFTGSNNVFNGFLSALLIGDRSELNQEQWDVLAATGTAHLMAISGLHIGLVALFSFYVSRFILALARTHRVFVLRFVPCITSIFFSGTYAALSGFAIPAQRAWLMICVVNIIFLFGRKVSLFYVLLLAAIFVVMLNPFSPMQNGFYLSFCAVVILVFFFANRTEKLGVVKSLLFAQWAIFCGLSLVLVLRQLPISLVSPIANIIAVPVVSFLVIPLLFFSAILSFLHTTAADIALYVTHEVFAALWMFLKELTVTGWLIQLSPPESYVSIAAGCIGLTFLLSPKALRLRLLGVALLFFFYFSDSEKKRKLDITVLDVGQGLSVVTQTENHTVVYDVGAKFSDSFDIGSRVVAPYLYYRGVSELDLVLLSHSDNDHSGGLVGLDKKSKIRRLAANHSVALRNEKTQMQKCLAGQTWEFDGVLFEVLWPNEQSVILESPNNSSCVVMLRYGKFIALYTGDIEKRVEKTLLANSALPKNIDLLIAPHHGSNTSSTSEFVSYLAPRVVIFSSGYKNPYGHPTRAVQQRYDTSGSNMLNTATDGALTIAVDAKGNTQISSARQSESRPWYP